MKIARESDFDTTTKRYDYTQKKKRFGLFLGGTSRHSVVVQLGLGVEVETTLLPYLFLCVYETCDMRELGGRGSLSFPINGGCFCANVMLWWCFCLCSSRLARLLTLEDGWVSGVCWMLMLMGMMIVGGAGGGSGGV